MQAPLLITAVQGRHVRALTRKAVLLMVAGALLVVALLQLITSHSLTAHHHHSEVQRPRLAVSSS